MRRPSAVAGIASCLVALAIAAPASAGTLDQQQTSGSSGAHSLISTQSLAQTFTADISGGLDQADLLLSRSGTPPSVTVEIRNTSAGKPDTAVLATGTIPASALGAATAFVPVTFAAPAPVTAGTQYALVAYSPGSASNIVLWFYRVGDPYPSGAEFVSAQSPPGSTWAEQGGNDLGFKTYVLPPETPPGTPGGTLPNPEKVLCAGRPSTQLGSSSADSLIGTPGPDVISGLGGNDQISGLADNDVICGGPGKDTVKGGAGQDTLLGQRGKDKLRGGGGADLCKGGKGKDTAKCEVEKSI